VPGATLDRIAGAGHFVQEDAADDCVSAILRRVG
jgi:pimeloyl-ACP methyl ester carboxylesterase